MRSKPQDYAAWKDAIGSLTGNPNGIGTITEENFPKFAEMYKAKNEGNNAEAKKLADELGIKYWPKPVKSHIRKLFWPLENFTDTYRTDEEEEAILPPIFYLDISGFFILHKKAIFSV